MTDDGRKLGKLDEYPQGKLVDDDEGALRLAIGERNGKVVVDFGTEVVWFAMDPQQAADMATALLRRAREAAGKAGRPIRVQI